MTFTEMEGQVYFFFSLVVRGPAAEREIELFGELRCLLKLSIKQCI